MFDNLQMKKKPIFMIIPMIDIIFFLLVFFMMNSLQTVAQKTLDVQLPKAQSATVQTQIPTVITIDEQGHIAFNNKSVSIDEARNLIETNLQGNPDAAVVLQADKNTSHGQVVVIMDMLKKAGIKKLAVAAE